MQVLKISTSTYLRCCGTDQEVGVVEEIEFEGI